MTFLGKKLAATPIQARVAPYILLVGLTVLQDSLGRNDRYWLYLAKMVVGLWCIWEVRSVVTEARWAFSWEAVAVGVFVFLVWVGLDPFYPKLELLFKQGEPWNPFKQFGEGSGLGWFFVLVRIFGSALVVPPLEEAFYRSFLYRYFVRLDFTSMPFSRFHWLSLIVTSAIFGLAHYQWLAGIVCGLSYQLLVIRKNRLGDAMTAHAITNALLGIWVVWKNAWIFW
jgi:uncharacterized protein